MVGNIKITVFAVLMIVILGGLVMAAEKDELLISNFDKPGEANVWRVINDGVMGGVSSSTWNVTKSGTAVFVGTVSLDNNGGFASVRSPVGTYDLSAYKGIALRIKGDGKSYKLNLKTDADFDSVLYQAEFQTEKEKWQLIKVPFSKFTPTYHGVVLSDAPKLDAKAIRRFGFLIADKQKGPFQLEVDWIKAYRD
jgi:NADH dehydrogenase [ubiquinone] 1 alpha subcomplex assembly factor 1